ncbi:hypothetical protein, partial [Mitsuokella sp. AF21-1AC]|uniref:hypothetical protein n=1 Tax=Mitsuokella sp. AF21-1AC TaxID=2292235 RepID=UPI001F2F9D49
SGDSTRLAVLVVLPKGKSLSGGMYSAWRRAAIARRDEAPHQRRFTPDVRTPRQAAKLLCCTQQIGSHLAAR